MIEIRDATETDLPRILAITNQAIAETTTTFNVREIDLETRRAWWRDRVAQKFPVVVAVAEGEVAAFGSYGQFRPWDGYLHTVEHSLYVDPTFQRRGLGLALLEALVARARAAGMHVMVGGIGADNPGSIALHRRLGFVETGRLPEVGQKFGRWLDLVFVQKMLADAAELTDTRGAKAGDVRVG